MSIVIKNAPPAPAVKESEKKEAPKEHKSDIQKFHPGMAFDSRPTLEQPIVEVELKEDIEHRGLRKGKCLVHLDVAHQIIKSLKLK